MNTGQVGIEFDFLYKWLALKRAVFVATRSIFLGKNVLWRPGPASVLLGGGGVEGAAKILSQGHPGGEESPGMELHRGLQAHLLHLLHHRVVSQVPGPRLDTTMGLLRGTGTGIRDGAVNRSSVHLDGQVTNDA